MRCEEEDLDLVDLRRHQDVGRLGERNDEKTKSTAMDAFVSKLSATKLGYYQDPYLPILLQSLHREMRKQPIINRGWYHLYLHHFLPTPPKPTHSFSLSISPFFIPSTGSQVITQESNA